MRRIRLVATDLDGTLLDPQGCITPRTRAAMQALTASGVILVLATSRRWTGVRLAMSDFDFRGPLILFDGAMIRSYPDGEILGTTALDREVAQRAAETMVSYGLQPIAHYADHHGESVHVTDEADNPEWTSVYLQAVRHQLRYRPVGKLCDTASDPLRLLAFAPTSVLRRVAVDLASPDYCRQLLLSGSFGSPELMLFSPLASKGNALAMLAGMLDIPLEETMAIGDGLNDISMLRVAGLRVAMGHAPRRVRASADAVTVSNAEDGMARALEAYVLGV